MRTARVWTVVVLALAGPAGACFAAPVPELTEAELKDRATKLNKETTTIDAADAKLKELLKDKITTAKLVKVAAKMQTDAKDGEKPFKFYAGLVLAKASQGVKNFAAADAFYTVCTDTAINDLQSGKMIVTAVDNQLDFLWERKKFNKVEELCDKVLALDGDKALKNGQIFFMERQIQAIAKQGETNKALDKADKLIKAFDGEWYFLQIRAWVQRESGKLDDAAKTYKEVLVALEGADQMPKESREKFARNVKYVLSGVYLDANKLDKSTELLEELIKEDPKNPTYYNDLGFLWADHDMKLPEAEKLVRKAIAMDLEQRSELAADKKLDPELAKKANPAYVDSMGWVLYKNKKYDEALKQLLEAAKDEDEGGHIEIWDHVGDCQLALGKKAEALATFQKSLKMEDVSRKDADRRKKVTEKIAKLKAELK